MKLKIIYSFENDLQRIVDTIDQFDWFKEKGYNVDLPSSLDIAKIKEYSKQDISELLKGSWNDEEYKNTERYINENWPKYSERFEGDLISVNLKPVEEYTVVLTLYGVGGSFNPRENKIILNVYYFLRKPNLSIMATILHEIVHINVDEYIQQYKVPHQLKEKIVDMIMKSFFANDFSQEEFLQKWLYSKSFSEKAEVIFDNFYPNIERAIQELSKQMMSDNI